MHYEPLIGGRLVELLIVEGGALVRKVGDRYFVRHPITGYDHAVNVLHVVPRERVGRICRKWGITTVRFHELLQRQEVAR